MRLGSLVAAALALPPALLWALAMWGRSGVTGISFRWLATLAAGWLVVYAWTRRGAWFGLVPAALLSGAAVGVLYASSEAYHAWVFTPRPKGLLVPLSVALVLFAPVVGQALAGEWGAAVAEARARWPWLFGALLGGFASAHAVSYSQVATDDLIRYWAIADAWAVGAPYAVAEGDPSAPQFYLIDVPIYPAAIGLSFGALGHRYAALHAPLALANFALPGALYASARAAGGTRLAAAGIALGITALPMAQIYVFGSAEPDPLWAALLAAFSWLGIRLAGPDGATRATREWLALGVLAALLMLTRPEGPLYAGPLALGLAWQQRRTLGKPLAAALVAAVPVLGFSAFLVWAFGIVWPTGFGNVASPHYVPRNVELVLTQNLPHYAASMGLPVPTLTGPLIAALVAVWVMAGALVLWRRAPGMRLYTLPLGLNLAVILVSPTDLAADHFSPPTFFRHWAIALPWLAPALAAALPRAGYGHTASGLILACFFVWESLILAALPLGPERQRPPVLTSDPYVLLTDLVQAGADLPHLPFVDGPGRAVAIDPRFDYLPFRQRLFEAVRPYNLHALDAGRAHALAAMLFGLAALAAAGVSGVPVKPLPARAPAPPPEPQA